VDYLSFLRLTRLMTKDEREVLRGYRQCVFNVVFNNRDDHPKNFSFLLDQKGHWKLSPAYDLTYSLGPGGEHQMDVCGEGRNPDASHLLKLAEKSGLSTKTGRDIIESVLSVAQDFKKEAKNLSIRSQTVKMIDQSILTHLKRLS
jgi:serine/threonine-protein kinase HipA